MKARVALRSLEFDFEGDNTSVAQASRLATSLLTDTPRARETDPVTSHAAAVAIKATGNLANQQQRVLDLVKRMPGRTCWELAEIWFHETGQSPPEAERWIGRRLGELAPVHLIKSEAMAKVVNGRRACTWWPVNAPPASE